MEISKSRKKIKPTDKEIKRAEELKSLRLKNNLSLEEVAQKLNISKVTLSRYENTDITNIPMGNIEKLAKIYNTSPGHIMGWQNESDTILTQLNTENNIVPYDTKTYKFLSEIGEKIRKRRIELKMTQEEFAKLTGYSNRSSITKIEKGKVDLTLSKLKEFIKILRVSPEYLMGYDTLYDFVLLNEKIVGKIKIEKRKIQISIGIPEDPKSFEEVNFNDEKNFKLKNSLQLLELSIKDIKITSKIKADLERAVASIFSENYTLNTSKINEGINQELPSLKYAYEGDSEAHNENIKLKLIKLRHRKEKYEEK